MLMHQKFACPYCTTERALEIDPDVGKQFVRAGCYECETTRRLYAVGRSGPSIQFFNRNRGLRVDGSGSDGDADAERELSEVDKIVAEIRSSGEGRVKEIADLEGLREEPRNRIIAAANERLEEIRTQGGSESEPESVSEPDPESETPSDPDPDPEPEVADATLGEKTSSCPGCGSEVVVKDVFKASACPACEMPLDEMFNRSRSRSRA